MPCFGTRPDDRRAAGELWVHRFHRGADTVCGRGQFEICRGSTIAARLLAGLLRLPKSGSAVPVAVRIDRAGHGISVWTRTFDRRRVVSRQYRAGGRMIEWIGSVELVFRETVAAEQIGYEQLGTRVRLFGRSVPLPAGACPHIRAVARACGQSRFRVAVTVALPRGEPLLTYSGCLEEEASRW
ncbi:MAG: DUF4166 domain-containing protein [Actinomycetes bacterium]